MAGFTTDLRRSPVHADPFTLGVASGEPTPDGVVLWTRLAPRPLTADGSGGMPSRSVDVEWELASDERFARVEQRGVVAATPQWGHSVHIETTGLRAGAEYFYRFRAQGFLSPVGRTRTAPQPDSLAPMTMCFASCSNYEQGWFTAYRRLAEEDSDLVLHLGDYLYETVAGGAFRAHAGSEAASLATYRQRYAQYKTDPDLQAAHAAAPWLVVFDDHELDDNWAGSVPEQPQPDFRTRRAAALRAYYENMPLRSTALPRGTDMTLFRRVGWGALATFHMLDTRGYRTDQVCGDAYRSDCPERADPAGSLLGPHQKQWLLNGFRQSQARWDLIGQQVFFSQIDLTPGAARGFNPDAWDGYAADRDQVTAGLLNSAVRNAVVLTGDVHSHWAAEVHERPGDVSSRRAATELVTTSISSGGDGSDGRADIDAILPENPHIRYFSNRRGYVRTRITADALRADFREVPFVTRPGAPVHTGATFVVPDRVPRLL
ncbi:alkaline phosphatase D family protein [Mycolicibacterium duvalii]|uniref:alkaline phosphatase D family protein n=1 Tax=Mycolicibacterium duvalii TaxID=39688 RepID=UPI001F3F244A|nr:alkaline phosphatase D family protein [Mycolicibacterium duvalii]